MLSLCSFIVVSTSAFVNLHGNLCTFICRGLSEGVHVGLTARHWLGSRVELRLN